MYPDSSQRQSSFRAWRLLFVSLLLLVGTQSTSLRAQEVTPLVINTILGPPLIDLENGGLLDLTTREAFRRLGMEVIYQPLPAQRSLLNLDDGIDDGNLARVNGLTVLFENIRKVPEEIANFKIVVFTRGDDIQIEGWKSLADYEIGIVNGWKIVEANTAEFDSVLKVRDGRQLFQLLKQGRVELVVFEYSMGLKIAADMGMDDIKVLQSSLAEPDLYLYLHKKHEALIPRIQQVFIEMKADGSYDKIYNATMLAQEQNLR